MSEIYFISVNEYKAEEIKYCFKNAGIHLVIVDNIQIQEVMDIDLEVIVSNKILQAYSKLHRPCVVEHGGLCIDALNGLPGGLSKVIWDTVNGEICRWVPADNRKAVAKSIVGYCDGQERHLFIGETRGIISDSKRGKREFQWDPIFIPKSCDKTYAELGFPDKMKYSQAAKAWRKLITHIKKNV